MFHRRRSQDPTSTSASAKDRLLDAQQPKRIWLNDGRQIGSLMLDVALRSRFYSTDALYFPSSGLFLRGAWIRDRAGDG
jgi:hypothetical protein